MDGQMVTSVLKIVLFLPFVLLLIYLSLKLGGSRMAGMAGGKLIRIVERVPLNSKSIICVALIDNKPYVIGCSEERVDILMELPPESLEKLNRDGSFKDNLISNFNLMFNRKDRL